MADYLVKILGDLLHKDAPEDDIDHLPSPHQLINKVCEFNIFKLLYLKVCLDIQGYPKRMRLQRRLYEVLLSFFLALMVPCIF